LVPCSFSRDNLAARFAVVLKRGGAAAVDCSGVVPIEFKPAFEGGLYVVRSDATIIGVNTGDCLHTVEQANVFRRPLTEVLYFPSPAPSRLIFL
jgi:hypothetical protein